MTNSTTPSAMKNIERIGIKLKNARLQWAIDSDESPDLLVDLEFAVDLAKSLHARVVELEKENKELKAGEWTVDPNCRCTACFKICAAFRTCQC